MFFGIALFPFPLPVEGYRLVFDRELAIEVRNTHLDSAEEAGGILETMRIKVGQGVLTSLQTIFPSLLFPRLFSNRITQTHSIESILSSNAQIYASVVNTLIWTTAYFCKCAM